MHMLSVSGFARRLSVMLLVLAVCLVTPWAQNALLAQSDTTPPAVSVASPPNLATGISAAARVTASFTEPVQAASISFVLRDAANAVVPSTTAYDAATLTVTLTPAGGLAPSTTFTATISGVKDVAGNLMAAPVVWSFSTGAVGFFESATLTGLVSPTVVQFASDGRIFVAEKSGVIKVFASLTDTAPVVFADLVTQVNDAGNRGLSGMALDPAFPAKPYVYVLYTYDAPIHGTAPTWGAPGVPMDPCPDAAGAGCAVSARLSRLRANGSVATGPEEVLVEDWFQQYPGQSVGALAFGPDGALYASAGDGASSVAVDTGQNGNPGGDPINEGGALRSQDLTSPPDPVGLDGAVIRVNPDTGQPLPRSTSMTVGAPTTDANGVKSYVVTSVFQGATPTVVRVLEPSNPVAGKPRRFLYVLPVEAGVSTLGSTWSDGLEELRLLDVPNRFNVTLIAPSFNIEPWYGDHATDPDRRLESFILEDLVPFGDSFAAAGTVPQRWAIGFSKSGNGVLTLMLRNPNVFSAGAAWDAPAQITDMANPPCPCQLTANFGTQANFNRYIIPTLVAGNAAPFRGTNRIWISGDQSAWTSQMFQLHDQMVQAGILHTWVPGGTRAHSWNSGWLDGAVTSLDQNATAAAPVDSNADRIVAYGLRSPSRLAFRPGTPEIWIGDAGWNTSEEINRIDNAQDGIVENFGWPCYEGTSTTAYGSTALCGRLAQQGSAVPPVLSYQHDQALVAGDSCATTGGSISGLAFYGGGTYPANYQGALFFADATRSCIWVMFAGQSGRPDPATRRTFLNGASTPVDLRTGPAGDVFYTSRDSGQIRRITYVAGNAAPTASIQSSVSTGAAPLTVTFNGGLSFDPEGSPLAFSWDLDGDGVYDDATSAQAGRTFATPGTYTVRLRVFDATGLSDVRAATIVVVAPTPPAITSANSATFTAGVAGSFTFTTAGAPTPALSRTGALPTGVAFVDNGNGTATLSGTPAAAGTFPLTVTAANGVGSPATQSFTLTVNPGSFNFAYVAGSVTGALNSGSGTSTTLAVALHQPPGAGHALICAATWQSTTATASMSDPNNGAWLPIGAPKTGVGSLSAYRGQMFYVPAAVNAATSVTLTLSSAVAFRSFECAEYSYTGSIATLDGTPQYSVTPASGSVATISGVTAANATDLIVAGCMAVDTTCAAGTGFTRRNDTNSYDVNGGLGSDFLVRTGQTIEDKVGVAGAQSATFGTANGDNVILGLVALSGGGPQAPAITTAANTAFATGTAGSFTVTATGTPKPSLSASGALPAGVSFVDNGNGTAKLSGTPTAGTGGTYALTITASNGVGAPATQAFTLTINEPPVITSGNSVTFVPGTPDSFSVTATGMPKPTLSESGALPSGVTFVNNGNGTATLSGMPAAATGGTYALTITASNGVGTPATQAFTLTVNQAPAITSASTATFAAGAPGSFTVTSTGTPKPSITKSGTLPAGVTLVDNGNGTATLSGTPAAGTTGTYAITIVANNGVGSSASQSFTLTVNQAPGITSATGVTFTAGTPGSFTVVATGTPSPALTETGALPSGVTFVDNGGGTATLSGTPAATTSGAYALTITASNGVGTPASQSFTLTVNHAPAITSAAAATFAEGTAGAFTVTTTGTPKASIAEAGALPGGVSFVDNGNGTATLSGTPAAGSGGTYGLSITAGNGIGSPVVQSFSLTVNSTQAPAITSASGAAFVVATPGTFAVTATGAPTPSLAATGALPSGVTFVNNGNGTATLSGTPAAGTAGAYALTITASNGVGSPASQSFTLTVNQAPAITSAASTSFTVGTAGTFTVTTSGTPKPSLTETGALPGGVTFVNNGNGTATLSGTPAAGSAGTYAITITASNGVGTAATQSFTLTVGGGSGGSSSYAYVAGSVTGAYNTGGSGTTLAVPLHLNPGAGHLLVCAATWQSSTATATISDAGNGTWTAAGAAKSGINGMSGYRGQMFYVTSSVSAATTVTLTISTAVGFRAVECAEYSYTGGAIAALDGVPQYSTTRAAANIATVSGLTTTGATDLVVADCLGVDTTCTVGTGFTGRNDANAYDAGSGRFGNDFYGITGQLLEDKVGVAAGAQSATFRTGTATDNVILGLLAFR